MIVQVDPKRAPRRRFHSANARCPGTFLIYTLGPIVAIVFVLPSLYFVGVKLGMGKQVQEARGGEYAWEDALDSRRLRVTGTMFIAVGPRV